MASLNTSSNGPNLTRSYQNVVNAPLPSGVQASSPTYGQWAVFAVAAPLVSAFQGDGGKESVLKVQSTGGMWHHHLGRQWPNPRSRAAAASRCCSQLRGGRLTHFGPQPAWIDWESGHAYIRGVLTRGRGRAG
jgi:hypothetical protein